MEKRRSHSLALCMFIICIASFVTWTTACRAEVCKRRRSVERNTVLLSLTGCTGKTAPWVRQLAYCLSMRTVDVALTMDLWYKESYVRCFQECDDVREGTSNSDDIENCVECFLHHLNGTNWLGGRANGSTLLSACLSDFVVPALSQELPTKVMYSDRKSKVVLPNHVPARNWWSITVKLPCKPPVFKFWGAACINNFFGNDESRDVVLTQNRFIVNKDITLLAEFDDTCRFNLSDVDILWDKSVPSFAAPQLTTFPSRHPPREQESANFFFDVGAYNRLADTDDERRRVRRWASNDDDDVAAIGFQFPCRIGYFEAKADGGARMPITSVGNRHLLRQRAFADRRASGHASVDLSRLRLTFGFDFRRTGCVFGASDVNVVVAPSRDWLLGNEITKCFACLHAESEEECGKHGKVVACRRGELCVSEIRHVTRETVHIQKGCKQRGACEAEFTGNLNGQCRPGRQGSVCRCCCSTHLCNRYADHCI